MASPIPSRALSLLSDLAVAEAAQACCRQPHLVAIPEVGHFVARDRPGALVDALNRCRP